MIALLSNSTKSTVLKNNCASKQAAGCFTNLVPFNKPVKCYFKFACYPDDRLDLKSRRHPQDYDAGGGLEERTFGFLLLVLGVFCANGQKEADVRRVLLI